MSADDIKLLQGMPVFGAINDGTIAYILERCDEVERAPGEFFFRETDDATCMYVLKAGRVAIVREHKDRQLPLAELGPGDCFGEMALIECAPRSAGVKALERCDALEMSLDVLHSLYAHDLEQFVLIQMNLAREMSRRLRGVAEQLFDAKVAASELGGSYRWYLL